MGAVTHLKLSEAGEGVHQTKEGDLVRPPQLPLS